MCDELKILFPNLQNEGFEKTSPKTDSYNCIAWAADDDTRWWQPDPYYQYYWPIRVRNSSLQTYKQAFESLGYIECYDEADIEPGFEKVAFYVNGFSVSHMARQLPSGMWTSKCGALEDITHTLNGLAGNEYGKVVLIMKRPLHL